MHDIDRLLTAAGLDFEVLHDGPADRCPGCAEAVAGPATEPPALPVAA